MKALLIALLCVSLAAAQSPAFEEALKRERDADKAYWLCKQNGGICESQYQESVAASNAVRVALRLEMNQTSEQMSQAAAELGQLTTRIRRYAACQRAKRWWQFWRICRY